MTASRIVIAPFVALWSLYAFAQAPPPPSNPNSPNQQGQTAAGANQGQANPNDPNAPNDPGAIPDTEKPNASGPDIVDDPNATPEQKASAEYSGPAVLSRGISASVPLNPQNIRFTPSVGLEYLYTSGLTGVAVSNGALSNGSSSGVLLTYSLTGQKVYAKDTFSLSFSGNLNHYFQQSNFDGTSNSLSLTWRHRVFKHLSFGINVSGQEYNQNNLLVSGASYVNSGVGTTLVTSTPATEVFDGRVLSFITQADVTYQMNARFSIDVSAGGFETRRASSSLYGDTGYQAGANMAYRITRLTTVGVYYAYTNFNFIGVYGSSDVNTIGFTYSVALNPNTELITRLGGSRLESTGLTSVALNPILALVLGGNSALEAIYRINYSPDIDVQLRHKVAKVSVSLAYARGVTPGNGVILTSVRQTGSLGANYKVGRSWSIGNTLGYDSLSGFGTTNQRYTSAFLDATVDRKIFRELAWHARFDYHHYLFDNTGFLRNSLSVSTGLVWSPGNLLERVW